MAKAPFNQASGMVARVVTLLRAAWLVQEFRGLVERLRAQGLKEAEAEARKPPRRVGAAGKGGGKVLKKDFDG